MKAMQLQHFAPIEQGPLVLADLPIRRPEPQEILVRVKVCGAVSYTHLRAHET